MRELARKPPVTGYPVRLEADSQKTLAQAVGRGVRRGEIGRTGTMRWDGVTWHISVERIKEPRRTPGWLISAAIGVAGALAFLVLGWLLIKLLTALLGALLGALVALVPWILGGAALVLILGAVGGRGTIEVLQKVTIRR